MPVTLACYTRETDARHRLGGDSALADSVNGIDSALVRLGSGVLSTIKHWLQQVKLYPLLVGRRQRFDRLCFRTLCTL